MTEQEDRRPERTYVVSLVDSSTGATRDIKSCGNSRARARSEAYHLMDGLELTQHPAFDDIIQWNGGDLRLELPNRFLLRIEEER